MQLAVMETCNQPRGMRPGEVTHLRLLNWADCSRGGVVGEITHRDPNPHPLDEIDAAKLETVLVRWKAGLRPKPWKLVRLKYLRLMDDITVGQSIGMVGRSAMAPMAAYYGYLGVVYRQLDRDLSKLEDHAEK